jgi:predicted dehydrogenase
MSKIKIGIIGMGRMGVTQFSIINTCPSIEIEAIADNSSIILTILNKYLSVKTFTDYNDLLEGTKLDAILVCTPPSLHYQIIKKAADKGLHIFVEKPFTTKLSQASELAHLYEDNALVNQVGYDNRFNEVFWKAKQFLENDIIGKIIRFKSEMFSCTIISTNDNSGWRASHENGGGAIFEIASHVIDLINFLIGKPDKIIGSSLNYIYSRNVEDAISSTFLYKEKITGTLYINWSDTSYRKPTIKMDIFGENGRLLADQHSLKIYLNKANKQYDFHQGWNNLYVTDIIYPVPFYVRGNQFTRQLYHFIECIQKKELSNRSSFSDGAKTMEVIEKIFNDYENNGRL